MWLDPYNQTDHPECKSRPDSGLSAITELDPGYITGIAFKFFYHGLLLFGEIEISGRCFNLLAVWHAWINFVVLWSAGPLSSVWKEWIKWCIEFGIEANAIIAVPYDWRLSPSMLEERDLYFHKLKFVFNLNISTNYHNYWLWFLSLDGFPFFWRRERGRRRISFVNLIYLRSYNYNG